jgi:hypothetical protein
MSKESEHFAKIGIMDVASVIPETNMKDAQKMVEFFKLLAENEMVLTSEILQKYSELGDAFNEYNLITFRDRYGEWLEQYSQLRVDEK